MVRHERIALRKLENFRIGVKNLKAESLKYCMLTLGALN